MNAPEDKPQWFTIDDELLWPLIGMGVATARCIDYRHPIYSRWQNLRFAITLDASRLVAMQTAAGSTQPRFASFDSLLRH